MESPLHSFETYINSLTEQGVFPTLERHSNGWTCVLRNSSKLQLLPSNNEEICWGETMLEAISIAVERLNSLFLNPSELHQFIDTGIRKKDDRLHIVKVA